MRKTLLSLTVISCLSLLSACTTNPAQPTESLAESKAQSEVEKLDIITEKYFNESLRINPIMATYVGVHQLNDKFPAPISKESLARDKAFEQKYLTAIESLDSSQLKGQELLTYQIFKRDRELALKGMRFNDHMMPLNQMYGIHNAFAGLGSGQRAQPFNSYQDYQNFIKRSDGFALYMDSAIEAMREGIKSGVVLPRPLVKKIIPQLKAHIVDQPQNSIFYGPVNMLEDNQQLSSDEKQELKADYEQMITNVLVPTYKKFHDFIVEEYLPNSRSSVGLTSLPDGKAWYQYKIEKNTTLPLTAAEIHDFGQQEVARILSEMKLVKEQVKFDGDLTAFFDFLQNDEQFYFTEPEQLIEAYTNIKDDINARVPQLFSIAPKADYEVKAVEAYRAASSAGASYQGPAPDGSRPGIFYINTHNLKAQPKFIMETLSIHEAAPGHHFQISIQQEVESLPMFRKFGGYTVFSEGWALYAESLGKEMGMFSDPYQWYGRLVDEQLRAMRLVVDTGLHAYGWSREKAIKFMADNSSMAMSDIESEVERYIAIPGQALSYKVGERAIRSMRTKAEKALANKFDVREFHTQILIDGALPMPILESKIDTWVENQKAL